MSKKPWMKLYVNEFIADTAGFTATQTGAYLCLILALWKAPDGTLPFDETTLYRIARCSDWRNWVRTRGPVLAKFMATKDGRFFHKRVLEERSKARMSTVSVTHVSVSTAHNACNPLKSLNTAVHNAQESSDKTRIQSPDSKNTNISAMPLGNSDHVFVPEELQRPDSLPRESKQAKPPRNRTLKNGASAKARAIFDRPNEGPDPDGIPARLLTPHLRKRP